MGEYVYRAQNEYINGTSIICINQNSDKDVNNHIANGTQNKEQGTRFISTTGRISIAKYKYSRGKDEIPQRTPIVLIDFEKLKEIKDAKEIYDFRDESKREMHLTKKAQNFARADREVTIEKDIPAECCKKIPPLMVDILSILEFDEQMKTIMNAINDMVMNDQIDEFYSKVIEKIEFNELEKIFMDKYYSDDMLTLESIGKTFFPDVEKGDIISQCIKKEILKKIVDSREFAEFILSKIPEKPTSDEQRNVNWLKGRIEKARIKKIGLNLSKYLENEVIPREKITATARDTKKNITKAEQDKDNGRYYIDGIEGHSLFVQFDDMEKIALNPRGIIYTYDENGKLVSATAEYWKIKKILRGEKPGKYSSHNIEISLLEINKALASVSKDISIQQEETHGEELLTKSGKLSATLIGKMVTESVKVEDLEGVSIREENGTKSLLDRKKEKNEGLFK